MPLCRTGSIALSQFSHNFLISPKGWPFFDILWAQNSVHRNKLDDFKIWQQDSLRLQHGDSVLLIPTLRDQAKTFRFYFCRFCRFACFCSCLDLSPFILFYFYVFLNVVHFASIFVTFSRYHKDVLSLLHVACFPCLAARQEPSDTAFAQHFAPWKAWSPSSRSAFLPVLFSDAEDLVSSFPVALFVWSRVDYLSMWIHSDIWSMWYISIHYMIHPWFIQCFTASDVDRLQMDVDWNAPGLAQLSDQHGIFWSCWLWGLGRCAHVNMEQVSILGCNLSCSL